MKTQTAMKILTRWMIRRDLQTVLDIDRDSFWEPWGEDAFLEKLRQRNCIGMVAVQGEKIVGFMVYELHKKNSSCSVWRCIRNTVGRESAGRCSTG